MNVYGAGDVCVVSAGWRVFDVHIRRFGGVTWWVVKVERCLDVTARDRGGGRSMERDCGQRLCHGGCHCGSDLLKMFFGGK